MRFYIICGLLFGVFGALLLWQSSVIDTKVQNELLKNHISHQNQAIKEQALQKSEIEAYNKQSERVMSDFLATYYTAGQQDKSELTHLNDENLGDTLKELQEVEYALKVFYASSP
ncbi:hypothetical protein OQH61_08725 [Helicobacter sp. MIT 21-1697]|uniref:hypothetical protein n=1 Tax=Helicobacter sp. MIT 21-1697 TaxID=2993733 RepID=UPI00224B2B34|nr:hypothetical protein [Helicobacter sp. MIT 21-1697]MCX2717814.1 hypothetical protein [Helicobacter sp. MIT 21-1697]